MDNQKGSGPRRRWAIPRATTGKKIELTIREEQILKLLVRGASTSEIATCLSTTAGTIRVYLHLLYRRLGVRNGVSAAVWYVKRQLSQGRAVRS